MLPLKDNLMVFESFPDLSDNSYALYDFLCHHGYQEKYKIYWYIRNKKNITTDRLNAIHYITDSNPFKKWFVLQHAKYIIYDHSNPVGGNNRSGQICLYLSHGAPLKGAKNDVKAGENNLPNYIVSTGELACEWTCKFWSAPPSIGLPLGFPRNDYFFKMNTEVKEKIARYFHYDNFAKVILWMPTFRKSWDGFLSEDYMNNETGLPIINTQDELNIFNDFLKENRLLVMLKIHPLQANLSVYNNHYSNIIIIKNSDLDALGVQLYEFVATSHVLITDYSSISIDYLLLNNPIIFTLPDYEQYERSRGFIMDNVKDYLPGPHVNTINEFKTALQEISKDVDHYDAERAKVANVFHKHQDGNSAKRIADALGL